MADFKNKVAVITGAGGVLCSVFAEELAKHGAKVALLDLKKEASESVAEKIKQNGGTALAIECDVLHVESLKKADEEIWNAFGRVDILINGAGGNHSRGCTTNETFQMGDLEKEELTTFFNLDYEGFHFVFQLNFMGTLLATQVFAKRMLHQKDSCIVNISSMSAMTPLTKVPAYSAAKAAISNFTQWEAVHFADAGIRVNAIAPGFFITSQNEKLLLNTDGSYTERSQKILFKTPMKRFGVPADLVGTLLFLCDANASGFITGTVIPVDGGFMAFSGV